MSKKGLLSILLSACILFGLAGCGNTGSDEPATGSSAPQQETADSSGGTSQPESYEEQVSSAETESRVQKDLGAMTPEEALSYMQETENLVIVDVAAERWYEEEHFEGAINIPIESLDSETEDALYMEIPADRPVLLHCRRGMIVPGAYDRVKELRPDIPEIGYIDGVPPFTEYNEWLSAQ